ncbi:MAG TPA: SAM-dependent methyltransferase [Alphaproteobacteria bacterium]
METRIESLIKGQIKQSGPINIGTFMQTANAHYYATRDPLGMDGDFTTAPEISQLFGEMIGLCIADTWMRSGSPKCTLVELGPGRGTLMADLLRATKNVPGFHHSINIHLVETSPALRDKQKKNIHANIVWHDDVSSLPNDQPLLIIANEFFDALPIRQAVMTPQGWQERVIGLNDNRLIFGTTAMPPALAPSGPAELGTIVEFSPARDDVFSTLKGRLNTQDGMMLIIDYGHDTTHPQGDTLQAVYRHAPCDVLGHIGEADLTSHVDFGRMGGGSMTQGHFLKMMGIETRLTQLEQKNPDADLRTGVERLIASDQMGTLFRVLGINGRTFSCLPAL